jgi:hypothetical protein
MERRRTEDAAAAEIPTWVDFARVVGEAVGCLYSSWPSGNTHIVRRVREIARLRATPLAAPAPEIGTLRQEADAYLSASTDLRATNLVLALLDALAALEERATRAETALRHVADEIKGQREHHHDQYWKRHGTRVYWAQVEGVARAALPSTEATTDDALPPHSPRT